MNKSKRRLILIGMVYAALLSAPAHAIDKPLSDLTADLSRLPILNGGMDLLEIGLILIILFLLLASRGQARSTLLIAVCLGFVSLFFTPLLLILVPALLAVPVMRAGRSRRGTRHAARSETPRKPMHRPVVKSPSRPHVFPDELSPPTIRSIVLPRILPEDRGQEDGVKRFKQ